MKKLSPIDFVRRVLNDQLALGDKGNRGYMIMAYKILNEDAEEKKIETELEMKLREIEEFIEKAYRDKERAFENKSAS